jgi:hypothetical protein
VTVTKTVQSYELKKSYGQQAAVFRNVKEANNTMGYSNAQYYYYVVYINDLGKFGVMVTVCTSGFFPYGEITQEIQTTVPDAKNAMIIFVDRINKKQYIDLEKRVNDGAIR